jgi:hypothetical protein
MSPSCSESIHNNNLLNGLLVLFKQVPEINDVVVYYQAGHVAACKAEQVILYMIMLQSLHVYNRECTFFNTLQYLLQHHIIKSCTISLLML